MRTEINNITHQFYCHLLLGNSAAVILELKWPIITYKLLFLSMYNTITTEQDYLPPHNYAPALGLILQ